MKNAERQKQRAEAERVGREHFPNADKIVPTMYGGRWIIEVWNGKRAKLYRLGKATVAEAARRDEIDADQRAERAAARSAAARKAVATRRAREAARIQETI